jgi:hypothetical protein
MQADLAIGEDRVIPLRPARRFRTRERRMPSGLRKKMLDRLTGRNVATGLCTGLPACGLVSLRTYAPRQAFGIT